MVGREWGVVTWQLERVEVGGRRQTPDLGRGVEVEGNVEVTLTRVDGGGGRFIGTSPESKGGTVDGASRTQVTIFGELVAGGHPLVGLVRAFEPGPTGRLGDLVIISVAFVGVDMPWRISVVGISKNFDRSKGLGCNTAG